MCGTAAAASGRSHRSRRAAPRVRRPAVCRAPWRRPRTGRDRPDGPAISVIGRPTSLSRRWNSSVMPGVKRMMCRSGSRKIVAICVLSSRFWKSLFSLVSCSFLAISSVLIVCSSSLTDCISSLAVSSSSLVACSSSLVDWYSSLKDRSSSFDVSRSAMAAMSWERVAANSCASRVSSSGAASSAGPGARAVGPRANPVSWNATR